MTSTTAVREQYDSVRRSVGLVGGPARGLVWVRGSDRVDFLHAMISNDVRELETGSGRYGTFLTHTGRILCDFDFYKLESGILIDIGKSLVDDLMEGLARFIIMDDVELEKVDDDWSRMSLQGPLARDVVEDLLQRKAPARPFQVEAIDDRLLVMNRPCFSGSRGFHLWAPGKAIEGLVRRVSDKGARVPVVRVDEKAGEILRIEEGIPLYGVDMDQTNHPLEAGLENAISLTKGCFVGQEAVAKAVHIGGVPKKLVRLVLEGSEEPAAGSGLSADGKPVGRVTSATTSILLRRPIALGYVKRALARPDTEVQIDLASGTGQARIVASFESA